MIMSNARGRPRGIEKKVKTSIYVSGKMNLALSALVCYRKQRTFSGALEYASCEMARQVIKEYGYENDPHCKPLFER